MKLKQSSWLSASTIVTAIAVSATQVDARPYPDRSGVCYFFRGETQELTQPCVISSGYGAGAHYATLHWNDGVDTSITMINYCPDGGRDDRGFCKYVVDNYEASPYFRDVFMNVTSVQDQDNLPCFRISETGNSVCYRFN